MSSESIYTSPPPPPTISWQKKWRYIKEEEEQGRRPTVFFSTLWLSFLKALSRQESRTESWLCRESEDLSGVGGGGHTAEARAFPYICPAPSVYSTTHTCQYIHSGHKVFTISGPLRILMPGAEQWNKECAHPLWLGATCTVHYYS